MTFGLAAVLLVLSVAALVLCCKLVRKNAVSVVLIVLLSVVVLALAAYMGLTLIFSTRYKISRQMHKTKPYFSDTQCAKKYGFLRYLRYGAVLFPR